MEGVGGHIKSVGALLHHCGERAVELVGTAHFDEEQLYVQHWCHRSPLFEIGEMGGVIRIPEEGHARDPGNELLKELQPFGTHFCAKDGIAGDIPPWPCKACHEPRSHRIANCDHDYGNGRR